LALCLPLSIAPAAAPADTPEPTRWYEVMPGDNLHVIAGRVLGERAQWPRLWRLNPEIKDPDLLRPGQRIRVLGAAPDTALIDVAAPLAV
jgi:nucleoid-associated protein YgaU